MQCYTPSSYEPSDSTRGSFRLCCGCSSRACLARPRDTSGGAESATIAPRAPPPVPLLIGRQPTRHRSAAGPVLDTPRARVKGRSWVHERARQLDDERPQVNRRADQLAVSREARVDGTLMNHRGSRFPPSGHGPHAALALKWLIASAPPEGRAPINRRAHLGAIRPSPLSCDLPLPLRLASPPRLAISSSVRRADLFDRPDAPGRHENPTW